MAVGRYGAGFVTGDGGLGYPPCESEGEVGEENEREGMHYNW